MCHSIFKEDKAGLKMQNETRLLAYGTLLFYSTLSFAQTGLEVWFYDGQQYSSGEAGLQDWCDSLAPFEFHGTDESDLRDVAVTLHDARAFGRCVLIDSSTGTEVTALEETLRGCISIPPEDSEFYETQFYKPFDDFPYEHVQCDCQGEEWTAYNLFTEVRGCVRPKPEDNADKDDGCSGEKGIGNPCNVATGNKYQSETDISNSSLNFVRSYNSRNLVDLGLGKGWRNNYQKRLVISGNSLILVSQTGRGEPWSKQSGDWVGDVDTDFIVTETTSGFTVTKQNDAYENYNGNGQLISETDTNGNQIIYTYNANNQLTQVVNQYGHSLNFSYDANDHLETVTDANGAVYVYEYDANDNMTVVIYPDVTPDNDSDNPRRVYHYENIDYPNHLTGITDENGDRYAIYSYDEQGRAILTEHAPTTNTVGQERFQLDYQD